MRISRGRLAGLVLVTAFSAAISGCTGGSAGGGSAPAAATDPKPAFVAATAELRKGNYTFTTSAPDGDGKGQVHLPSRSAAIEMALQGEDNTGSMNMLLLDADRYVRFKMDLGDTAAQLEQLDGLPQSPELAKLNKRLKQMLETFSGKKWMHVDASKVTDKKDLLDLTDPDISGASALLAAATGGQLQGNTITGTLDAAKAVTVNSPLSSEELTKNAAQIKQLPFTATLDGQGRLAKLVIDVPAIGQVPAHKRTIEITGYGTAKAQQKPPVKSIIEMPDEAYELLNR